jgi:hypothetical protein
LDLGGEYEPDEELRKFLEAGDPPVYIGYGGTFCMVLQRHLFFEKKLITFLRRFGSVVVDDSKKMTGKSIPRLFTCARPT